MTKTYINYNNQGLLEPGKDYSFSEGVLSVKNNIVPFDKNQRQQAQALRKDFGLKDIGPKEVTANGAEPTGILKATEMQAAMAKNTTQESSGKKPGPGVQMPFTPPPMPTR